MNSEVKEMIFRIAVDTVEATLYSLMWGFALSQVIDKVTFGQAFTIVIFIINMINLGVAKLNKKNIVVVEK